jgi:negative regulator of flagellin synthesis FlgM
MDIRDVQTGNAGAAQSSSRARRVDPARPGAGGAPDAAGDRVTMSDRAQVLQRLRQAALAVPEVRLDRVESLKRRLAEGTLVPDPDRIARALIDQRALG